jgi:hypothetical protein
MKVPTSVVNAGAAFWVWGGNDEIDIQEINSNYSPSHDAHVQYLSIVRNAINYVAPGITWPFGTDVPIRDNNGNLIDLTQTFHTYGMELQPNYINFFFDGSLITHVDNGYRGLQIGNFQPMNVVLNSSGAGLTSNPPTGHNTLEVDYFHYFKHNPVLTNAVYNSSSNTITLTANTADPTDIYSWSHGYYVSINGPTNTNVANISLSSSYNGTSVSVSATGTYPPATSTATFVFQQNSNNICGNPVNNNVYLGTNINAPQSGCSSTVVLNGTNVIFVAPGSISLNPGFEVQLGGTFSALTQ